VTPRERVVTALRHREPDRVPFAWNFGPTPEMAGVLTDYLAARGVDWPTFRDAVDDIRTVSPTPLAPAPDVDIWGIRRAAHSYGTGSYDEIVHHPLAGVVDPAALDGYPWPDPAAYDFEGFRAQLLAADPEHVRARKLSISTCGNPFEIYCWMTGLEEALVNVLLNPELVRAALGHIADFFAAKLRDALAAAGDLMDILYFADDLGGQQGLLLSRKAYRAVIRPAHARLFALGKALAPHAAIMFHSDGAVFDILPDLIDAGVEVLEAVQTDAAGMDPARLKAAYGDRASEGGRLAFHGGIPVQSLLPHTDAETVAQVTRRLVATFGAGGGYVAAPTHAVQVGTPVENVLAMLRAVLGEADFAAAWRTASTESSTDYTASRESSTDYTDYTD
jgi:uroporphyrinogen decarboxylase